MSEFENYLQQKKIDSSAFRDGNEKQWEDFNKLFEQMHPNSFTAQKAFLINKIRRQYPLKESVPESKEATKPKPKVKIPARKKSED